MVVLQSPGLQYTRPGDRDRELYKWRISFGVRAYTHLHVMVSNIVEGQSQKVLLLSEYTLVNSSSRQS